MTYIQYNVFDKIQTQYVDIYAGKLKQLFSDLNLEGFSPYLENTTYLVLFFIFLLFCCSIL